MILIDIVKFRNIADYLLKEGNYSKSYDTYFKIYSEIWVAISKFNLTSNKLNLNSSSDELRDLISQSAFDKIFFEHFKLKTNFIHSEFLRIIFGRLQNLFFSNSISENFNIEIIKPEIILLLVLINHPKNVSWLKKIFQYFLPVSENNKLKEIKLLSSNSDLDKIIIREAALAIKKSNVLPIRFFCEFLYKANMHNEFLFKNISSLNRNLISSKKITQNEIQIFINTFLENSNKFNHTESTEREKALYYGEVLGLEGKITKADIRKKYHQKMAIYHPDAIKNKSEELLKLLEEKSRELNIAFEWFRKKYQI